MSVVITTNRSTGKWQQMEQGSGYLFGPSFDTYDEAVAALQDPNPCNDNHIVDVVEKITSMTWRGSDFRIEAMENGLYRIFKEVKGFGTDWVYQDSLESLEDARAYIKELY